MNIFYFINIFIYFILIIFSNKRSDKVFVNDDPGEEWEKRKNRQFTKTEKLLLERFKSAIDY